jgi:hypothetical protein
VTTPIIFLLHLVLGYVPWLLILGAYVWPRLGTLDRIEAHRAIAALHSFRFFGLVFLVPGIVGGSQGSTGRHITSLLLGRGISVRAFVHKLDERAEDLRKLGAEVVQGDLLNPASIGEALKGIRRAYFTYAVTDGLLEATTIFAVAAEEAKTELVVNNSQLQRKSPVAPSYRNMQHSLADQIFDWAGIGVVHLHARHITRIFGPW